MRVRIAAFGKHPAWDDHTDDIGLESDVLVGMKRLLYVEGIAGNIDSGAWEKLSDEQRLDGFDHLFLWRPPTNGHDVVIGRFWSSRDGKGRTRYPMVVCAHCTHTPLDWVLSKTLPALERLKTVCQSATTASGVREAVEAVQRDLHAAAPADAGVVASRPETDLLTGLWSQADLGPEGIGLARVLYQIEREMGAYRPQPSTGTRSGRDDVRPRHIRVPSCAPTTTESVQLWLRVMATQLDPGAGLFIVAPMGGGWVDLIVGEPGVAQFFVVRASRATVPLTSEIPYNIEPQFLHNVRQMIAL